MNSDLPSVPPDVLSEQLTHRAQELWNSGRLQQASEVLEDALRIDPGNDRARADAGLLCLIRHDTEGAKRFADEIRVGIRGHGAPDLLRLRLAKALRDVDTIETIIQAAIESAHDRPELTRCLAQLASEAAMGGYPISPDVLGDWRPQTTEEELHYIYLLFHCGDRDEALDRLESLLLRHPADPWVARCAASIWNATGNGSRSIDTLYEALEEDPQNALVLRPLLNRLVLAKREKEAVAIAKRLMAVEPSYITAERCLFRDDVRHMRLRSARERLRRLENQSRAIRRSAVPVLGERERLRASPVFPWRTQGMAIGGLTSCMTLGLMLARLAFRHPLGTPMYLLYFGLSYALVLLSRWIDWKFGRIKAARQAANR